MDVAHNIPSFKERVAKNLRHESANVILSAIVIK
jgi:hypothetical protein